jgi:hypothetical protein
MLFMRDSKHKGLLLSIAAAALILSLAALYWWQRGDAFSVQPSSDMAASETDKLNDALKSFIDVANDVSSIQLGAAYNYSFVRYGNSANFGILRCRDEVRCDNMVEKPVAKFEQPNQPSPDSAEVDPKTDLVVSLHRAVPGFVGGDLPQSEIEVKVREFLNRAYPVFTSIESTLTFRPGMKGVRLNNGNYFFRWEDASYTLPDGLSVEVQPFVQIGITSSGFIFSYDNTIDLYRDALTEL